MRAHLTRRELVSIHHLLWLVEWCNSPAWVAITGISVLFVAVENCWRPGPSLRLACRAGTESPGSTIDMTVTCQRSNPLLIKTSISKAFRTRARNLWHWASPNDFPTSPELPWIVVSNVCISLEWFSKLTNFFCRREDLEDMLSDPVYFQAVFHSLQQVGDLYNTQSELGMANEAIASR